MAAPSLDMQHPVTGAVAQTTEVAFYAVWEAKGWELVTVFAQPLNPIDSRLRLWAAAEAYDPVGVITRNEAGVVTEAVVRWPDSVQGIWRATIVNDTFDQADAWTISHQQSARTVMQPQVTRDDAGDVIYKPELVVF